MKNFFFSFGFWFAAWCFRILEALIKIEKTGCKYFDNMLSVVSTMLHTYQDKHQVTIPWYDSNFVYQL